MGDLCVETGACSGWHMHVRDYIFLQIGDGMCTFENVSPQTGEAVRSEGVDIFPSKSCNWRKASFNAPSVNQLHNASPTDNLRQIVIEFLEDAPRRSPAQVAECLDNAVLTTNVGTKLLFENDRCRVHDFSLAPHTGQDLPWHHHTLPYFFVNIC